MESPARTNGGDFDSPVRATAIMLNVLLETDLNNRNIPRLMEYLSKAYKGDEWYSTQDNAFTLLAFGKSARMASGTKVDRNGDRRREGASPMAGGNQRLDVEPYGKKVSIVIRGRGRVYYTRCCGGDPDGRRREDGGPESAGPARAAGPHRCHG